MDGALVGAGSHYYVSSVVTAYASCLFPTWKYTKDISIFKLDDVTNFILGGILLMFFFLILIF
jgi:hypothetical protein